jgi:hypothetical protein
MLLILLLVLLIVGALMCCFRCCIFGSAHSFIVQCFFFCTYPLLLRTMKRQGPFQANADRDVRRRFSLPECMAIGNTHTYIAPTAMGPTVAMGFNEAHVVPGFADGLGVAGGFAVTGAFACAASSSEASEGPDEPQYGTPAIEAGASPDDPMMPRLHQFESAWDRDGVQHCHVCDMLLNGPEQYAEHRKQNKHRKALKKRCVGENC